MSTTLSHDQLLRSGYLPEVLPPVFTSETFADFVQTHFGSTPVIKKNKPEFWTSATEYSATKRGSQRRTFGFPHPEAFHDLALYLSANWTELLRHCDRSPYSKSTPNSTPHDDRAIGITSHKDLSIAVYKGMSPYRYTVKTDISRFYPSVYTHSITWAIYGKEAAKADLKTNTLPHAKLDRLVRQSQEGQSVGLPVGPDSSRIVAEIVASAVDAVFAKRSRVKGVVAIRHVDDVWIGAQSMDQAEEFLYTYRECLREFNLDINDLKTSILPSSDSPDPPWPLSIKMMIKNDYQRLNSEDKARLLSEIFRMAHEQKDDGIIKYAIRRFDREKLWWSDWDILEAFLIRCVTGFPHSIDYVARVVAWANRSHRRIAKDEWQQVVLSSLVRNSNLGNDSEVSWLLWLMKELVIPVPNAIADTIVRRCGAFAVVMLFSLKPAIIKRAPKRQKLVAGLLGTIPFRGSYWLLAYEAVVKDWLSDSLLPRAGMSDFLKAMVAAKVSFFDAKARPAFLLSSASNDDTIGDYAIEDTAGRYDDGDDDEDIRAPWRNSDNDDLSDLF